MALSLAFLLALARFTTPEVLGGIATTISVSLIAGLLVSGNYGAGAIRFLPELQPTERGAYVREGCRLLVRRAFACWALVAAVALLGAAWPTFQLPNAWLAGLLLAPLTAWLRLIPTYVAALGQVVRASLPHNVVRPALLLSGLAALVFALPTLGWTQALTIYIAALVLAVVAQFWLFRGVLPTPSAAAANPEWRRTGYALLMTALFLELSVDLVVVIGATVLTEAETGGLSIVMRTQALALFGVTSINMVASPRISAAHASGDSQLVNKLLRQSAYLKLCVALSTYVVVWLFAEWLLNLFGAAYVAYADALRWAALTPLIMALAGPVVLLATLTARHRRAQRAFVEAFGLLAALGTLAGWRYGVTGVVLAFVIAWAYWHLRLAWDLTSACRYSFTLLPARQA